MDPNNTKVSPGRKSEQHSSAPCWGSMAASCPYICDFICQGECQGLCHQQVAQGWLSPQTGSELRLLLLLLELLREGLLLKTFQSYPGELHDVISVSAPVPELHLSSYKRDCCTYYGNVIYLFYTTGKFKGNHFTSVLCRLECSQQHLLTEQTAKKALIFLLYCNLLL